MEELKRMLYSRFKEEAIIRQCGDNRVELEVNTHIPKEEWKKRMEGFEDTSKIISDSSTDISNSWQMRCASHLPGEFLK